MEDVTHANLQAYDAASGWWRAVAETVSHRLWIEIPTMRRLAGDLTGQDVMALGCGTGQEIVWLLEQGARTVLGVDGSRGQLRQAGARVGDRARFVHAEIEHWAMPEEGLDLVISCLVLDHVRSLDVVLESIRKALRVGGRVIFSLPHPVLMGSEHDGAYMRCVLGYDRDQEEARIFGDYLTEREIVIGIGPHREPVHVWVRSVSRILTAVLNTGLTITAVEEPCPPKPAAEDGPAVRDFKLRYRRLPHFLIVEATRPAGGN
jgi:SAM-dependent methyltransferase